MTRQFIEVLQAAATPVIMEIKRRDAHGANLLGRRSIAEIVTEYQVAGAPCLSVVTGRWFGGHVDLLREVRSLTDLPVLQKDFITKEADILQARELGASAVLLTAHVLTHSALQRLIDKSLRHGLTPFVEVVNQAEIEAVTHAEDCVIAVNNKDIRQRERVAADFGRSLSLLPSVLHTGTPCPVSASGIDRPEIAALLISAGFSGLLIGTGLLRSTDLRAWLSEFARHRRAL